MTYVWPTTLLLPQRPPKLIYLDLLHWISLAKAYAGRRDGEQFKDVLAASIDAVHRGAARFPISDTIYMEVSKIGPYRQRVHLGEVIEQVSAYVVVMSRSLISAHEVETMLDRLVGPSPRPTYPMNYIDWGVARAFGLVGGFRVLSDTGEDITDEFRSEHPNGPEPFDMILMKGELGLNRMSLRGPNPEEEPILRKDGWNPRIAYETATRRAMQEIEQVARFDADPSWRRGRIRDVISAREVAIEIGDHLSRGLAERSATLEGQFPRVEDTRAAFDSMPSFDVAVTMKTEYHRDPTHRWTPNDIHDIDALGSTLPYCDIVVTDKAAASHARRTGLSERLGTTVIARLSDLPALLYWRPWLAPAALPQPDRWARGPRRPSTSRRPCRPKRLRDLCPRPKLGPRSTRDAAAVVWPRPSSWGPAADPVRRPGPSGRDEWPSLIRPSSTHSCARAEPR
jgi:hypothetical protein